MSAATAGSRRAMLLLNPYAVGGPVVVGVDGGPRSARALRWAAEEAWRRYTEVVAVHACIAPASAPRRWPACGTRPARW